MSTPYTLDKAAAHAVKESYQLNGDAIGVIEAAAKDKLPNHDLLPSTAEEAIRFGAGNCFAHCEVTASIARHIPGVKALISLNRFGASKRSQEVNADCLIVLPTTDQVFSIYEGGAGYVRGRLDIIDGSKPEAVAVQALSQDNEQTPVIVHGVLGFHGWISRKRASLETAIIADSHWTRRAETLVMTPDIGIPTLHAISTAGRLWRQGDLDAYHEHCSAHSFITSYFDVRTSVEEAMG